MSKKTIKQRIALVAVSALTAGILSVASAPVANAAAIEDEESTGLLTAISGNDNETTRTAVLLSTGVLRLSGIGAAVKVSAGARITEGLGITGNQLCATGESANTSRISITPVGAAGSTFTVTEYTDANCTTPGAITEVITVTIAATNLAGIANAGESTVRWDTNNSGAPDAATDAAAASTTTGNPLHLYMNLEDAYGSALSANGALVVTASSGAILGLIDTAGGSGTPSTASNLQVYTSAPTAVWIQVAELTAGAGWAGTVTVTHNGVAIATKSGKITGNPTSIAITAEKVGRNSGGASTDAIGYQVKDAAGNNVVVASSAIAFDSSSNPAMLASIAAGTDDNTTSAAGDLTPTCTQSSSFFGTANLVVKHTLANGTVIKSNSLPFTCGGNAESYTASWDKASYTQGDVAKLTVSFKDSKGGVANSYALLSADPADQAVSASQMERVTGYVKEQTANSKGVVEYSFSVGTSVGVIPGKYNAVVSYPTVNAVDGGSNASASYEIASTGAVSNADVLKSIVSLIASINKQIQALQKLILKRK